MLKGRFGDTSGRPYMEGRLYFPRLKIQGDISFLLDTGADSSMLMPADAIRIGIPFDQLEGDIEAAGIGGTVHCYPERAVLVFTEPNIAVHAYDIPELSIMQNDPTLLDLPSILGNVLDQWRITYDPQSTGLRARVRSADLTIPIK